MSETAREIEVQIDDARRALGSNFQELETKVKSAADWKLQFQKSPMKMAGLAFGGGIVLAALLGRRRRRRVSANSMGADVTFVPHSPTAWDGVKGALLGLAVSRFTDLVADVLPGFREHYDSRRISRT